jgi:hypothetical protein
MVHLRLAGERLNQCIELPGQQTVEIGHGLELVLRVPLVHARQRRSGEQLGEPRHPASVPHGTPDHRRSQTLRVGGAPEDRRPSSAERGAEGGRAERRHRRLRDESLVSEALRGPEQALGGAGVVASGFRAFVLVPGRGRLSPRLVQGRPLPHRLALDRWNCAPPMASRSGTHLLLVRACARTDDDLRLGGLRSRRRGRRAVGGGARLGIEPVADAEVGVDVLPVR